MVIKVDRKGISRKFVYPLEFAGEDIEKWHPSSFYGMSVRDICSLSRSTEDQIFEILEYNGITNETYGTIAMDEMKKDGFDVYDTELYREGDNIIVICYALLPDERDEVNMLSMTSLN